MKKKSVLLFIILFIITYLALTRLMLIKTSSADNPYLYQLENAWQFKTAASAVIAAFLTWCFNGDKITLKKVIIMFIVAFVIPYLMMSHMMYERRVYEKTVIEWLLKQVTRNFKLKAAISAAVAAAICLITIISYNIQRSIVDRK